MSKCGRCSREFEGFLNWNCDLCRSTEKEQEEAREEREEAREEAHDRAEAMLKQADEDHEELLHELADSREAAREDLVEATLFLADQRKNPGDYDCPSCCYKTLKYWASRCPTCQADVKDEYWQNIYADKERMRLALKAAEKERDAEWERGAPARASAAAQTALEMATLKKNMHHWKLFRFAYLVYLLPLLVLGTAGFWFIGRKISHADILIAITPVTNWWWTWNGLQSVERAPIFYSFCLWNTLGLTVLVVTYPMRKGWNNLWGLFFFYLLPLFVWLELELTHLNASKYDLIAAVLPWGNWLWLLRVALFNEKGNTLVMMSDGGIQKSFLNLVSVIGWIVVGLVLSTFLNKRTKQW